MKWSNSISAVNAATSVQLVKGCDMESFAEDGFLDLTHT